MFFASAPCCANAREALIAMTIVPTNLNAALIIGFSDHRVESRRVRLRGRVLRGTTATLFSAALTEQFQRAFCAFRLQYHIRQVRIAPEKIPEPCVEALSFTE